MAGKKYKPIPTELTPDPPPPAAPGGTTPFVPENQYLPKTGASPITSEPDIKSRFLGGPSTKLDPNATPSPGIAVAPIVKVQPLPPDTIEMFDTHQNKLVSIAPHDVPLAWSSGRYNMVKGATLPIQLANGEMGTIPAESAHAAITRGARFVSPLEYHKSQIARDVGPIESALWGAAEGALPSLSLIEAPYAAITGKKLPISSDQFMADTAWLLAGKNPEDIRERQEAARQGHGFAHGVGELAGIMGSGLGLGKKLGFENPTLRLGGVAEDLTARALGHEAPTALGRIGKYAAPLVARGLVEGGILGADASLNEDRLGDPNIAAGKLLADIGHGALIGGAFGGAVGGLGGAWRFRGGRLPTAPGLGELGAGAGEIGERTERALLDTEAAHWDAAPGEVTRAPDAAAAAPGPTMPATTPTVIPPTATELPIPKATAQAVESVAEKEFGFVPKGLGEKYLRYADNAEKLGGDSFLKKAGIQNQSTAGKEARAALLDMEEIQDAATRTFRANLDELTAKTRILSDEARAPMKRSHLEKSVSKENPEVVGENTWNTVRELHGDIENMLAQRDDFGLEDSLKSMKRYVEKSQNNILKHIRANDNVSQFEELDKLKQLFGRWTENSQNVTRIKDPYGRMRGMATRDAFERIYERMRVNLENADLWGAAAQQQKEINAQWTRHIDVSKRFNQALSTQVGRDEQNAWRQAWGVDPAKVDGYTKNLVNPSQDLTHKTILDYVQTSEDLSGAISKVYELPPAKVKLLSEVKDVAATFRKTVANMQEKLVMANQFKKLLESERIDAQGLLGQALGSVVGVVTKPANAVKKLAQLERAINRTNAKVKRGVAESFKPVVEGEKAAVVETKETLEKGFEQRAKEVRKDAANIQATKSKLEEATQAIAEHAPKIGKALVARALRITTYLAATLPPEPTKDPFSPDRPTMASAAEQSKWMRIEAVADNPFIVLLRMKQNRLTKNEVAALKYMHPDTYDAIRESVLGHLQEKAGKLTYQQKLQQSLLWDIAATPSMKPQAILGAQQVWAGQADIAGQPIVQGRVGAGRNGKGNLPKQRGGGGGGRHTGRPMSLSKQLAKGMAK